MDHIQDHHGDHDLFWNTENWQPLCAYHHNRKTASSGWDRLTYYGEFHLSCTVVCGPPGSGKTTFVRNKMLPGDLVVDLDAIYEAISFCPTYDKPSMLLPYAMGVKEHLIGRLASDTTRPRSWVITMGASRAEREYLQRRLQAKVIVLPVGELECLRRISQDARRSGPLSYWEPIVRQWWAEYRADLSER